MKLKEYRDKRGQRRCLFCGKPIYMRRVFCTDVCSAKLRNLQARLKELEGRTDE